MPHRRDILMALIGLGAGALSMRARGELNDDGLHTQPWFLESFLDLRDDLAEADAAGNRFVVLWEQKGCPYCREMHQVNLAKREVRDFVRDHFTVLQLNLWGSREVTDFDGKSMEERDLARRWRVNFTPTLQFFPASAATLEAASGVELEVARMPGYFKPFHFLSMFQFVKSEAYRDKNFQRFLQERFAQMEAEGIDPNVW